MVDERRLLIVATYVSELGTGDSVTGATCTGIACGGGGGGAAGLQPAATHAAALVNKRQMRRGLGIENTMLLLQSSSKSLASAVCTDRIAANDGYQGSERKLLRVNVLLGNKHWNSILDEVMAGKGSG
jgi:hypothetical protein